MADPEHNELMKQIASAYKIPVQYLNVGHKGCGDLDDIVNTFMIQLLSNYTNTNTMEELKQQITTIVHMVNTNSITPTEATNQLMALHKNVYVEQASKEQGAKQDNTGAGTEEE